MDTWNRKFERWYQRLTPGIIILDVLHATCSVGRCISVLFICSVKNKLAAAELNRNPFKKNATTHEQCIQMACGSAQPQEVSTTHQNIMFLCETQNDLQRPFMSSVWSDRTPVRDMRQKYWRHSTFGLPFSFNSFDPSKDLQSLLFKCYFIFTKNDNTIHEYSCTLSTHLDSNYVQSSTQKVTEEAIFHIIIILSVIDRNKSMQYSSLVVIFLVSDLAPSLRWGQWERPEVSLRFF